MLIVCRVHRNQDLLMLLNHHVPIMACNTCLQAGIHNQIQDYPQFPL
uniref:Uncharacterized protein n=1 Tax=Arundo donax TaxID=35708 RepID=A0A0A9G5R2_ARUDO